MFVSKATGCAFILVVLACGAKLIGAELPDSKNYFPLDEGAEWTYKMTVAGKTQKFTNKVAKIETIDDKKLTQMESSLEGKVVASEHLTQTDKGVFRHRISGIELSKPVEIMRYPAKDGDTWEGESAAGNEKMKLSAKVTAEEVTVPAGSYKAARVDIDSTGAQAVKASSWYVPDVGMVKQIIKLGPVTIELELEKYEPAKKK
jgi:hypothetical protein